MLRRHRIEVHTPDAAQLAFRIDEIQKAATEPAHGRDLQLSGRNRLPEWQVLQSLGAVESRSSVLHLEKMAQTDGPCVT